MYDLKDLLALPALLDPRRKRPGPAPRPEDLARLTAAAQGVGSSVAAGDSTLVAPPPSLVPLAPPVTRPASEFETTAVPMIRHPKAMPAPGEEEENDALVRSRIEGGFTEGGDYHTRPRIADPLSYTAGRVAEMELEPKAKSHHGRLYEAGAGAWRGFQRGGIGGALVGLGLGAARPGAISEMRQREDLEREQGRYAQLYGMSKAQADLQGEQTTNEARAATIPYLLARPDIERSKLENKAAYDSWRMKRDDRKQDSAETYVRWRMENGDRRATTAEGLAELKKEWQDFYGNYLTDTHEERKRHNLVGESQSQQRIGLIKEGLSLRQYLGEGQLSQGWARIGQGYDRMGAAQQKQVDTLAEKAAKAEAQAAYFDATASVETDAVKKAQAVAAAKMMREQSAALHSQAEGIANRPAPQISRPQSAPPVSEEDFVSNARQRLGAGFNEAEARATWRRRYGR
jgi:hypothetical protein